MSSATAVRLAQGDSGAASQSCSALEGREHFVQFYEQDEFLIQAVGDYAGAALSAGETALIIATRAHLAGMRERLAGQLVGSSRERLVELEAAETLSKFMVDGVPDAARFDMVIGGLVRELEKTGRRIRAFGEMVALLWADGNATAAQQLEGLWNELASRHAFTLFCAYPLYKFGREIDTVSFARICQCHTRVIPAESYATLSEGDERDRAISVLQQKAYALEAEIVRRKDVEDRLARREGELFDFLESASEGLHQVGPDGRIVWANPAELALLGYSRDEYVGHDIRKFHADADVIDAILTKLLRGERIYDATARLRCKDGSIKHVLIHSSAYFEGGKFSHSRCFTRDVTRLKEAEEQQQQLLERERAALAEAQRISRMKDEFLANLSHELRTPLNAILGWTQVVRDAVDDQETVAEGMTVIERNVRSQTQLVEDLLDMSRIIAGKVGLDLRTVRLTSVLESALDAVRPSADEKQIKIKQILDPLAGQVQGDAARLQQVVGNLLSNAVKFTPKGGKIEVLLERVNSHFELTVSDSGRGIDPEFLPYVFERFRQEDASITRKHGGLGIGLSIVKQLTELHGGTVSAKSAGCGKGASFIVSLPVSSATLPEISTNPILQDASATFTARLRGAKILVVDDDSDARALVARVLREHAAQVLVAASAEEALAHMQSERPDVLVSDIGMPFRDGFDLIREIRRRSPQQGGSVRAVALTAFARSEDRVKALRAGYQMHLAKPIESKELVLTVASLIRA